MYTKIGIFGVISALLVAAIYSSSVAFAAEYACFTPSGQTKTSFCSTSDQEIWHECTRQADGSWKCVKMEVVVDDSVSPALQNTLDGAIATKSPCYPPLSCEPPPCDPNCAEAPSIQEEFQNTIKVPKTGILDDGRVMTEGDANDTKVPEDLGGLNNDNGPTINPGEE